MELVPSALKSNLQKPTPSSSQRAVKSRLTYNEELASDEEEAPRKAKKKKESSSEEEYAQKRKKRKTTPSRDVRPANNKEEIHEEPSNDDILPDSEGPILLSPRKGNAPAVADAAVQQLLHFTSFRSPIDSKYWSYIKNEPGLKPSIFTSNPHYLSIVYTSEPPTLTELARFPESFQKGINCDTNKWLLTMKSSFEVICAPPSDGTSYKYKVHVIRLKDADPPIYLAIEWIPAGTTPADEFKLF